jgi:hypothetical protein
VASPACQPAHVVHAQSSISRSAVIDALAGSVSGVCGVIVGQPFDTIRVRQQTRSTSASSMISLIRKFPFVALDSEAITMPRLQVQGGCIVD